MNKNIKIILGTIIVIVVLIAAAGFYRFNFTDGGDVIVIEDVPASVPSGHFCYAYHQAATPTAPYKVDEYIDMKVEGATFSGTKHGTQAGPDMTNGYEGTLAGTIAGADLTAKYAYTIEGSDNTEQEIYKYTKDGLKKWRYPLKDEKGILVPDTTKEYSIHNYDNVDCLSVTLPMKYMKTSDFWPPEIKLTNEKFECKEGGSAIKVNGITAKKEIAGRDYCVTTISEGAAGSTYSNYTYRTAVGSELATFSFMLRTVQCMNYDNPKQAECLTERQAYTPDFLASTLMKNMKF